MTGLLRCEIDGVAADAAQLAHVARFNHGHFTSLQVRDGAVRGLDLHLARLVDATRVLYRTDLDPHHVRMWLRHAVRDVTDASVRITVFAPDWRLDAMPTPARVATLVAVAPPSVPVSTALRVRTVEHERFLPQIKHVGTFALFELRAQARRDGFDDALFFDRRGRFSEGAVWNIGFCDGNGHIVWPDAPQLDGITMQLLQRGLRARGIVSERRAVHREQLANFRAAFACNAGTAIQRIACIDDHVFDASADLMQTLADCYDSQPPQPL